MKNLYMPCMFILLLVCGSSFASEILVLQVAPSELGLKKTKYDGYVKRDNEFTNVASSWEMDFFTEEASLGLRFIANWDSSRGTPRTEIRGQLVKTLTEMKLEADEVIYYSQEGRVVCGTIHRIKNFLRIQKAWIQESGRCSAKVRSKDINGILTYEGYLEIK